MTDEPPDAHATATAARRSRRQMRAAIAFGVVMATIEMGVLLYFAYC